MCCVCATWLLYPKKPNPEMRRKIAAHNGIALKNGCKLLELAMEEVNDPSCQEYVSCVRILTRKQLNDL
jgi:hypothetical protein